MGLLFKIVFLFMFSEILYPGTFYFSKSIDQISSIKTKDKYEIYKTDDLGFKTYSIGYYDTVWEKRKVDYTINLGLEILQGKVSIGRFNIVTFYSMFNYKINKSIFATIYTGLDFYNKDWENYNDQIYRPETKGGPMYGLGFTYIINKKFPLSLDCKVYTFSEVSNDVWKDVNYKRVGGTIGYKF